ncbi:HERC6 [Symbiodinium natans]|uniref:HERC6 protein n=1 Tax=Symbiodinium natans TaxID=878477 RepID=A0A812L0S8_9DINO|nr:HERC6 [Symbiodinium natans]
MRLAKAATSPLARLSLHGERPSLALPLAAGALALGAAALSPVQAKEQKTRQQVFAWGRAQAHPGGSSSDVLWPRRVEWFEENPHGWKKVAFGPDFGAALDKRGQLFVWGAGPVAGSFIGPLKVDVQGDGRGQGLEDVQLSSKKMFALTRRGDALVFEGFVEELLKRGAPAAEAAEAAAAAKEADEEARPALEAAAAEAARRAAEASKASKQPLRLTAQAVPGLPRAGLLGSLWGYKGRVKSMSIGLEHGCFVTRHGQLYCVGGNEWGQCAVQPPKQRGPSGALDERTHSEVEFPVLVEFPPKTPKIVSVQVGGRHTVAQDAKGNCHAFGDDRRIQLGLGDTRSGGNDERHAYGVLHQDALGGKKVKGDIPRAVTYRYYDPHLQSKPVKQVPPLAVNRPEYPPASAITCGEDFTVGVFRDSPDWYAESQTTNVIFACGENGIGQCGRSMAQQQQAWGQVRLPKHSYVESVTCGQAHCLALMRDGQVFSWGGNPQGQVGNGKRALVQRPVRVTQQPKLPEELSHLADPNRPATVTPADIYKQVAYQHVASRMSNDLSQTDAPPMPVPVDLPGRVVSLACGFRSSAVICEVPDAA